MRHLLLTAALLLAMPVAAQEAAEKPTDLPAGTYHPDLGHTRLLFKVNHLGFSTFIGLFTKIEATLQFDPAAPETMQISVTIDPKTVETHYPDPAVAFNEVLSGPEFMNAEKFPVITYNSTKITLTGPTSADVTGDLTLLGVTKPVTLQATFNGGWAYHPMDVGGARIGFSAKGSFNRSDFGMGYGVPMPGSTMGVSDRVDLEIEVEFSNPDAPKPEGG
jgi:polyisoprenoid-binding protein YceI